MTMTKKLLLSSANVLSPSPLVTCEQGSYFLAVCVCVFAVAVHVHVSSSRRPVPLDWHVLVLSDECKQPVLISTD